MPRTRTVKFVGLFDDRNFALVAGCISRVFFVLQEQGGGGDVAKRLHAFAHVALMVTLVLVLIKKQIFSQYFYD